MKVYVEAKSKADLIRRLAAGEEISGYNYSMFGGGGHYMLDDTLEEGTIIAVYSQMSQGNPVAKSWGTWTNGVLKAESFNAENWGGDPEGPLAKALDKARSADPTPPLVIESFGPDTDMKYLIEVAKTCSPVVTVDDWDVFVDELREQAMDHIVTMTARYVDASFTQNIGAPVEVYYGDDPSDEGGVAAHDPDTGKVVEEINESRYFAYMDDAEGEIIQAAYREAHGKLPWDKDAESFALEHRDIDPREHHRRRCPNCHGNLYAEGCVHRGIMPLMRTAESFAAPGATTFPHLFKKATTGKIQEWRIRTEELPGGNWAYISSHGKLGGSMVEGKGVVIKAGKQGRTVEEQANAEAASKWKKKRDTGYFETADEAENTLVLLPMLALDHKKRGHNIEWPAIGQPKLDGIRCLARLDSDGNISLTSRKNKPFPGMDHIRDELAARLQDLGKSVGDPFPNDIVIDGELYADPDELTFQQVTGLVRRDNKKPEDIENEKKLKLNVYDSINVNDLDMDFIDRHDLVSNNLRGMDSITIVENTPLADPEAVDPIHDQFVREGYEGLIIRNLKGPYKLNGRSKHLQKYKSFQDAEYEIVGYEEGKGNYDGTVIWVCETPEGKRFKIKPNGTHEQRSTWFENADDYIGHRITVRFFELTDDGIPRFPTGGWFRNYEAEEWELNECAFCETLIYDDEDSTEFEDEYYHDICLSHWLHMDEETFEAESFAAGPAKQSAKMKGFLKRLTKLKKELRSREKAVRNKATLDIQNYGTPLGNKQGERRVEAIEKKITNLNQLIKDLKTEETRKKLRKPRKRKKVGLTNAEKRDLRKIQINDPSIYTDTSWASKQAAKKMHPRKKKDAESFEAPRTTATTFKKQGMWIRSWGDDDDGGDDGGVGQRQREQNKKARELVKKMKSQGWTKIPNPRINKTLNDQNLVPQLISAMKKYNADVKKKWGGKKIKMWGRCSAANYFLIDLEIPLGNDQGLTEDENLSIFGSYHPVVNLWEGELGGYGAMMKKGNQYRLIMTGGTDDDEAGYWSTPVVQFALKSSPTPGKAPPKPRPKTKAKKTTRKKSAKAKRKPGRKAPTISATRRKIGTRMRGNDGRMWEVKKSGKSRRWIRGAEDTRWSNFGYRSTATTKGIDNLTIPFDEPAEESESHRKSILIGILCGSAIMAFISSKLK